jgi:hypothetical protein
VTRNGYRNTINGFTGARAVVGDERFGGTVFWTATQTRLPTDREGVRDNAVEFDRERGSPRFWGAFGHKRFGAVEGEGYLYRLAEDDADGIATRDRRLWTVGARALRAPKAGQVDFEVEGVYQFGRTRASAAATDIDDLPVRAGFLHAAVGRSFEGGWRPRVQVAFDAAGGDGRGRRFTRFDTLFGGRVFDFGPTSFHGALQRSNLLSPEARVEVRPGKKTDGYVAIRPVWLASRSDAFAATEVRDATGRSGSYAGTQIDARVRYWLEPERLRVSAGALYLAKGRFLRDAPNAPGTGDTRYGFVEISFTP